MRSTKGRNLRVYIKKVCKAQGQDWYEDDSIKDAMKALGIVPIQK